MNLVVVILSGNVDVGKRVDESSFHFGWDSGCHGRRGAGWRQKHLVRWRTHDGWIVVVSVSHNRAGSAGFLWKMRE